MFRAYNPYIGGSIPSFFMVLIIHQPGKTWIFWGFPLPIRYLLGEPGLWFHWRYDRTKSPVQQGEVVGVVRRNTRQNKFPGSYIILKMTSGQKLRKVCVCVFFPNEFMYGTWKNTWNIRNHYCLTQYPVLCWKVHQFASFPKLRRFVHSRMHMRGFKDPLLWDYHDRMIWSSLTSLLNK